MITFVDIKRNGKPPALLSQRDDKQQMERPKRARDTEVVTRGENEKSREIKTKRGGAGEIKRERMS